MLKKAMRRTGTQVGLKSAAGFSLIELIIGMTVLLIAMGAATRLLSASFSTRTRENLRTEALADAQRALNIMSHDIANSGFGLLHGEPGSSVPDDNGLVIPDSALSSIRVRANIHNDAVSDPLIAGVRQMQTDDPDEDVSYVLQPSGALVRWDNNSASNRAVLANRITSLYFVYLDDTGAGNLLPASSGGAPVAPTAAQISSATRVRIDLMVRLPATHDAPSSVVRLSSDVTLRNSGVQLRRY
jgi:prepilin-type N-terminal cleavage/methylation domain-containing protein